MPLDQKHLTVALLGMYDHLELSYKANIIKRILLEKAKITLPESSHLWTHMQNVGSPARHPCTASCQRDRNGPLNRWASSRHSPRPPSALSLTSWQPCEHSPMPTSMSCQGWLAWLGRDRCVNCRSREIFSFTEQKSTPQHNK